ncbi:multidrug effflux MFS transporter [Psychrobacter sp. APC 3281]|uniref:multidrug effflux MFS transporter n=1 Tax=unclassified Psychrobacter TaxID=196806 RepID=UPI000C7D5F03|nr:MULTISPECIES: multidrug effflux MFS transporter [unclassified Psychrobacter]MDN3446765.1 multidrug effflux MFS transporter [Psychrobacter sp. APC 3281]PKH82292.1 Bcr/CflA family drug resistance efflux transporter [Psychrobacter sp. 4Bb]
MTDNTSKTASTTGALFLSILGALMAVTSLSTDIYLPAMPEMAKELQGDAELTITGFLVGFAIAQLVWGPISDQIGRRKPLFIGMVLFTIGSLGCALSNSMEQIIFWRVFQAFGACTAPMLARAMVRDLFSRNRAAQMLSTLMIIMAIAPIGGPLLGGQIITFTTWHSIFILLAIIGGVLFFSIFLLPETLPINKRKKASIKSAFVTYFNLLSQKTFMRYTLCVTFYYVSAYAFITGSPAVYITYFGIDAQHYGWLFAVNIIGVMGMSFINRFLVHRFELSSLLKIATSIATCATVIMAVTFKADLMPIYFIIGMAFIFFSMNGIVAAVATAAALDEVPSIAGSASALIGSLQYGSGIISTLLLSYFSDGTPWAMVWIMCLFALFSFLIVYKAK